MIIRSGPSGKNFDIATGEESYGLQSAWAIDPLTGSDDAPGTPESPLATLGELNARLQNVLVQQATTLALVGDVTDTPLWLSGTRFLSTFTVSGTRTTVASAIPITAVSGLGPAGTFPWQLTTSGFNWSTANLQHQYQFSGGQIAAPLAVVDANNVIMGPLYGSGVSVVATTPTTAMTLSVSSLSRALPPLLNCSGLPANSATPFVILQHLDFNPFNQHQTLIDSGCQAQLYGCSMTLSGSMVLLPQGFLNLRACRINVSGSSITWRSSGAINGSVGLVVVGNGSTSALHNHQQGVTTHSNLCHSGVRLLATGAAIQISTTHIRGAAGPVLVQSGGLITATGIVNGSDGNTGIGIDVPSGRFGYLSAGVKPTVTGASDTRVGGTTRTYAQIPYTNLQLDAVPPTVTTLTGNGAAIALDS